MRGLSRLASMRSSAESRMTSTWAIGTDGGWVYDTDAGEDVQAVVPLFTTRGRLKVVGSVVQESEAGSRTVVESRRELHIPVSSPAVPVGAVAQCTAVSSLDDPTMLGVVVRLSGSAPGSQTTARRLEVTEVLS